MKCLVGQLDFHTACCVVSNAKGMIPWVNSRVESRGGDTQLRIGIGIIRFPACPLLCCFDASFDVTTETGYDHCSTAICSEMTVIFWDSRNTHR